MAKLYSSLSAMGFLQRGAPTRASTPSSSRSATNCGGPGSSEQLSPNCLWISSSVTGGDGDLAWAGGGGGCFFCATAVTVNMRATTGRRNNLLDDMFPTLVRFCARG